MKKSIKSITKISIISGLISGVLTGFLFYFVLSTAWFFFIIPAIMSWSIKKYSKISLDELEENLDEATKRAGVICASMTLLFIILTLMPLFIISILYSTQLLLQLLVNFMFYIVLIISVYSGYKSGVGAVMDVYYDKKLEEE